MIERVRRMTKKEKQEKGTLGKVKRDRGKDKEEEKKKSTKDKWRKRSRIRG